MSPRVPTYLFVLIILISACAPSTAAVATSVGPTQEKLDIAPTPSSTPMTKATSIVVPKQRDLIFVEFFAIT